jgi:hypothetical protein
MIKMDIALRELAIARLRQSITNTYQQRLKKAISTGTEMRLASEMQRSQRAQSLVIVRQGFNQAFRDVAPLVERSPDARQLADALRTRLKSLLSELSEGRSLPPGVAVALMLAEDQAAPAAQR